MSAKRKRQIKKDKSAERRELPAPSYDPMTGVALTYERRDPMTGVVTGYDVRDEDD